MVVKYRQVRVRARAQRTLLVLNVKAPEIMYQGMTCCNDFFYLPRRIVSCTFDSLTDRATRVAHEVPYAFIEGNHAEVRLLMCKTSM